MTLLPETATRDARRLLITRVLRGFADGAVAVVLASYLTGLGFSALQVGVLVTGTMLGSAALTLAVGLWGGRFNRRRVLVGASALMLATGVGFAGLTAFWPLVMMAVVGTLNPSSGDVSVFLPVEQAVLAQCVADRDRTALFAWYNLAGGLSGAVGALASAVPAWVAHQRHLELRSAERWVFVAYAGSAVLAAIVYASLSAGVEPQAAAPPAGLRRSRRIVLQLAALFSLDSMGGGLVVQSLLVLWLYRRFGVSLSAAGQIFFVAGLLGASSQLASSRLAARIGLIETMVYTHLPSNLLLVAAGLMPSAPAAIACLVLRMSVSSMDVPARQSYVMAVVPPEERAAAASVTNVPRSLAAALTPAVAGWMLERSSFAASGGFGFDAQWSGFGYDLEPVLTAGSDAGRDLGRVVTALTGASGGDPFARVLYLESHDTVGNGGARLVAKIDPADPTSWYARKRALLGAVVLLTAPGAPMIFQGGERLVTSGLPSNPDPLPAPAASALPFRACYRDLVRLRRNLDGLRDDGVEILHRNDAKVLAYRRHGASAEDVLVVVDFRNRSYTEYDVGVADGAAWRVRVDTDWTRCGADFAGGAEGTITPRAEIKDGRPFTLPVRLGAYSAVVLSR